MSNSHARYVLALREIGALIEAGCSARTVAAAVLMLDSRIMPSVSRFIEDKAQPGTFAEAVFDVLCGD